jgi:hypothetical protein
MFVLLLIGVSDRLAHRKSHPSKKQSAVVTVCYQSRRLTLGASALPCVYLPDREGLSCFLGPLLQALDVAPSKVQGAWCVVCVFAAQMTLQAQTKCLVLPHKYKAGSPGLVLTHAYRGCGFYSLPEALANQGDSHLLHVLVLLLRHPWAL